MFQSLIIEKYKNMSYFKLTSSVSNTELFSGVDTSNFVHFLSKFFISGKVRLFSWTIAFVKVKAADGNTTEAQKDWAKLKNEWTKKF